MKNYSDTITNLSKTDNGNFFIENENKMISGDKLAKLLSSILHDEKSMVDSQLTTTDAIYYLKNKDNELDLYFFEFKKIDFYSRKSVRDKLTDIIFFN